MAAQLKHTALRRASLWLAAAMGVAIARPAIAGDPAAGCAQGTDPAEIITDCSTLIDSG
jgi:hypothetical protein